MSFHYDTRQGDNEQYSMGFEIGGRQSDAFPTPCSALKAGGFVLLKGHPCKITDIYPCSADGSVVQILGTNVQTGEIWEDIYPLRETVFVPRMSQDNYSPTPSSRKGSMDLQSRRAGPGSHISARSRQPSDAGRYLK
ncbi:hypothetical protein APSETT444_005524 [Aspergillus pseudonomiae]